MTDFQTRILVIVDYLRILTPIR